jgi:TolB-like protein
LKKNILLRWSWKAPLMWLWCTAVVLMGLESTTNAQSLPVRVVIFPFHVNAENDLDFIRKGMLNMLSSRLTFKNEVEVLDSHVIKTVADASSFLPPFNSSTPLDTDAARRLARQLKADYVLTGSLTEFGQSISIDATMIDINEKKQSIPFFSQAPDMDGTIPAINRLAAQINHKIFGRETYIEEDAYPKDNQPRFDIHTHPEKLIEQGFINY